MMAVASAMESLLRLAGGHVPELMERLEQRLGELATGHGAPLARYAGDTIAAGGKRLRPLLVFVAAGPVGDAVGLVRAAVAVELLHSATLVHDDVLDGAPTRRGRPTVISAGGRLMATLTGDLLFSRAFAELARNRRADEIRALSAASSALADGELLQRTDAWDQSVTVERYLLRCELKTARLFQSACELAAMEAARPVEALGSFGRRIGLAFQMLDDVLDMVGPSSRTGKQRGTDLLDGTVTLPLILARERDPELARLSLRELRDPEQAERVCERIEATGALDEVRARAGAEVAQAKDELPELPSAQRQALELVADAMVERYA